MKQNCEEVLFNCFGYKQFRRGQREIIDSILTGRDVLAIMPTGAGKSICFQLPALMLEGVTIVISPLISLMQDQVRALSSSGINAAYINSSLTKSQIDKVFSSAVRGEYKLIYVAPERLESYDMLALFRQLRVSMVTVDEAHCVSQWGQDFRPSYLKIAEFISLLPTRPVVTAFTATATEDVKIDIVRQLGLRSPYKAATGFDRPNLYFAVSKPKSKYKALAEYINKNKDKSGIIYCATKKAVEEVCEKLCADGYSATRYHAGLTNAERKANQEDFINDDKPIIAATNAFGMGIDKSNVGYVVHYNMPKNIESYYQEAGRAGRDGSNAECLLLFSSQDVFINNFLIDNSVENENLSIAEQRECKERDRKRLKDMINYCNIKTCLRSFILEYFGDEKILPCNNCGNCVQDYREVDITIESQKIMSCIKRMGERYGLGLVIDVLKGKKTQRIQELALNQIKSYAIMSDSSCEYIKEVADFLVVNGYVGLTNEQFQTAYDTQAANDVLFSGKKVFMNVKVADESEQQDYLQNDTAHKKHSKKSVKKEQDNNENSELFALLKLKRTELARAQQVPAYIIFTDATLTDMCAVLPKTLQAMTTVSGIGAAKQEKYGQQFLDVILEYSKK